MCAMTFSSDSPSAPARRPPGPGADRSGQLQLQIRLLSAAVEATLRQHPQGLSELDLIRALQRPPWSLVGTVDYSSPTELYPVHFLLFHVLYRLRDELLEQGETLTIAPLTICLSPSGKVVAGDGPPDLSDPLRAFYLDLSQYDLSDQAIQRMVEDFWAGRSHRPQPEELEAALEDLGLTELPSDFATVKHTFRRAVMKAHPDRGGSTEKVQTLNQAFALLRHHFRSGG